MGDKTGTQDWNGQITPGPSDIGFDYSFILAATGDRVPCVFIENERVINLDPKDPISVSDEKNFEGEPAGKLNPELLKMHPSHGHDLSIENGTWKFIAPGKGPAINVQTNTEMRNLNKDQLYDLSSNRGEQINVAIQNPKIVEKLRSKLEHVKAVK